jgi:hypothetical protein
VDCQNTGTSSAPVCGVSTGSSPPLPVVGVAETGVSSGPSAVGVAESGACVVGEAGAQAARMNAILNSAIALHDGIRTGRLPNQRIDLMIISFTSIIPGSNLKLDSSRNGIRRSLGLR